MTTQSTPTPLSHAPQRGKPGHCHLAQIFDAEGNSVAAFDSTEDPAVASERARRMASLWNACADLPQDALDGGWTACGLSVDAVRMEEQIAQLERELGRAQQQMERQKDEWLSWESKRKTLEAAAVELEAVRKNAQRTPDVAAAINLIVDLAHRKGELWERCQGKGWPEPESEQFKNLRDKELPQAISALQQAVNNPAPQPVAHPAPPSGYCWDEDDLCFRTNQQPEGEVVITTDQTGMCVAVTRQDAEGKILKVLWEAPKPNRKPLFADLIAQHPGLREELKAQDEQPAVQGEHAANAEPESHMAGHFLRDFGGKKGHWQQCKEEIPGLSEPLFTHPKHQNSTPALAGQQPRPEGRGLR